MLLYYAIINSCICLYTKDLCVRCGESKEKKFIFYYHIRKCTLYPCIYMYYVFSIIVHGSWCILGDLNYLFSNKIFTVDNSMCTEYISKFSEYFDKYLFLYKYSK